MDDSNLPRFSARAQPDYRGTYKIIEERNGELQKSTDQTSKLADDKE